MARAPVRSAAAAPTMTAIVANGVVWVSLAVYGLLTSTVVFRATGQADYGVWATVAAFRTAVLFVDGGLAFGVTRDVALATQGDTEAGGRLRTATRLYLAVAVLVGLLGTALSWLPGELLGLGGRSDVVVVTALIGVEAALALAFAPANASLRGIGRFDLLAAASVAMAVVGGGLLLWWTPQWALVGAAAAVAAARLVGGIFAVALLRRTHRAPEAGAGTRQLLPVVRFAGPMWAIAVASALGMATDVPIAGAFFGAEVAGAYGIGAVLPMAVAAFVFALLDTAFPRLTTLAKASLGQVVRVLATVGTLVAGVALAGVAVAAPDILSVWVGASGQLEREVTAVYALVWLVNMPAHVLALAAIAKNRHGVLVPVVLCEAGVNIALSLLFAGVLGPIGPAVATLLTLSVSNLIVVPVLLGPHAGISAARLLGPVISAGAMGVVAGTILALAVVPLASSVLRVGVHVLLAGGVVTIIGLTVVRGRTAVQRWLGVLFDGGWRVLRQEALERQTMAPLLAIPQSALRSSKDRPLVTIRIATYNRGPLVAERAIASAQAQSYENVEILVVGDHCDEATERAVRGVRDSRIRFENLPVRGDYPRDPMFRWMVAGAAPMNRALELARGEWIAPLDDDDEFTVDHVEVLLDACLTKGLDVAYGKADMEVEPGEWEPVGSWPPGPGNIIHASVMYAARLRPMRHSVDSWRLNEPGDWNLWRRMRAAGARFGFVDRVVVRHYLEYRELREALPK